MKMKLHEKIIKRMISFLMIFSLIDASSTFVFADDTNEREYTLEYGTKINQLGLQDMVKGKKNKQKYYGNFDLVIDAEEIQNYGRGYYPIGEYDVKIKAKGMKTQQLQLIIKDTKAPSIFSHVYVEKGYDGDLSKIIVIKEMSVYTIEANTSLVNVNQVGDYIIPVTATDVYSNSSQENVDFEVWYYTEPANNEWQNYRGTGFYYKDPSSYSYNELGDQPCYSNDVPYDYYVNVCVE